MAYISIEEVKKRKKNLILKSIRKMIASFDMENYDYYIKIDSDVDNKPITPIPLINFLIIDDEEIKFTIHDKDNGIIISYGHHLENISYITDDNENTKWVIMLAESYKYPSLTVLTITARNKNFNF